MLIPLFIAWYWLLTAYISLNSPRVNAQVSKLIEDGIKRHINSGNLKGATSKDIDRIRNYLSLIYTFTLVLLAPFISVFNILILTFHLLKKAFSRKSGDTND